MMVLGRKLSIHKGCLMSEFSEMGLINQEFKKLMRDLALQDIFQATLQDETEMVHQLLKDATIPETIQSRIKDTAASLVEQIRKKTISQNGLEAFLQQYDLSTDEGVALMCLAESLLRIPDSKTIDDLIQDTLTNKTWHNHVGKSQSLFVNAA